MVVNKVVPLLFNQYAQDSNYELKDAEDIILYRLNYVWLRSRHQTLTELGRHVTEFDPNIEPAMKKNIVQPREILMN